MVDRLNGKDSPLDNIHKLLDQHKDLSVIRERMGEVWVTQELPHGKSRRIMMYLSRDDQDQVFPDVGITVKEEGNEIYSYLKVRPIEKGKEVIVDKLQKGHKVKDILEKAKAGVKIFQAFLKVPPQERYLIQTRAYDWMGGVDPEVEFADDPGVLGNIARSVIVKRFNITSLGFTDTTPTAQNTYKYIGEVLNR